jgi:predicted ATP-dependent endonuclease of OLD family
MQQTFIKQIEEFVNGKGWNVQIIITTHSSHIVSNSDFTKIRYFLRNENNSVMHKNMQDLHDSKENIEFLKRYITLEKSDMFFADSVILVE